MRRIAPLLALLLIVAACSTDDAEPTANSTAPMSVVSSVPRSTTPSTSLATTAPDAPDAPTTTAPSQPPASLSAWSGCGSVECATLTVPLDYTDPDGPTAQIPVARRRADSERVGVLLINPGGPGAAGTDYATGSILSGDLLNRFDLITWDPRGTGGSTLLTCSAPFETLWRLDSGPDGPTEQAQLDRAASDIAGACDRDHADVLPHVDTESTVADMDALRRVLDEEEISYLGFSYGTHLGLRYAERYGDRLRAMALDGVVDPDRSLEEFLTGQLAGFLRAFDDMAGSCGDGCPVDDVEASLARVLAMAESEPIPTSSGPALGPADVVTGSFYSAYGYSSQASSDYHRALADAENGDGTALRSLADRYHQLTNFPAYTATTCLDFARPESPEDFAAMADRLDAIDDRFGAGMANEMSPCGSWPDPTTGPRGDIAAPDAPTVLVLGNTGDQATPYENSVEVADELSSAVLLTFEGTGHLSYRNSACVRGVTDRYLIALELPGDGARC